MWAITRHASLTYFRKHRPAWQFRALAQIVRAETWLRQGWAARRKRPEDVALCRQVRGICRDLLGSRPAAARGRLEHVLQQAGMSSSTWTVQRAPCATEEGCTSHAGLVRP
jgi:hypothetical protein